jgi:chemotaxis protein MotA
MDLAMIIGLAGAFGSLLAMVFLEHASPASLLIPGPMVLVFGATIAVGIAGTTLADAIQAFKTIVPTIRGKRPDFEGTIDRLIQLADLARHNGLLSLESEADGLDDTFLSTALQGVADGTDSEDLAILLQDEIATRSLPDRTSAKFFASLGGYAPTIGIIGTVVSLTHVLANLSTPGALGPMIASAFVATLWGLLSANFIWLPLGTRINRLCDLEAERMHLVLEGVLAIQSGTSARALGERLSAMVPARTPRKEKATSSRKEPVDA